MKSRFIFKKHEFSLEQGSARFFYELQTPDKTFNFTETLLFPLLPDRNLGIAFRFVKPAASQDDLRCLLQPFLDSLLIILGVSYWKTFCPKIIETPTIQLTKDQAFFWNKVYTKGLGEFFYQNKIDYRGLIKFPNTSEKINDFTTDQPDAIPEEFSAKDAMKTSNKRSLLLFGAGKDSIVSAELLKKFGKKFTLLQINSSRVQDDTARITEMDRIVITRIIDFRLFALNKQKGVCNGHIPVTAIWEFIGLFAAALYGYSYVIASNEYSANYGNVSYLGEKINHQWSKSSEFENLMQAYTKIYITPRIVPFSLLRAYNELQIVKQFIANPRYFPYFSSCNSNFKIGNIIPNPNRNPDVILKQIQNDKKRWCGICSKCLFVFILLTAFLPKKAVMKIFNKNLYENRTLLTTFKELLGIENTKPFECVGTPEETKSALYKAYRQGSYNKDFLMKYYIENFTPNDLQLKLEKSNLPEEFKNIIKYEN